MTDHIRAETRQIALRLPQRFVGGPPINARRLSADFSSPTWPENLLSKTGHAVLAFGKIIRFCASTIRPDQFVRRSYSKSHRPPRTKRRSQNRSEQPPVRRPQYRNPGKLEERQRRLRNPHRMASRLCLEESIEVRQNSPEGAAHHP